MTIYAKYVVYQIDSTGGNTKMLTEYNFGGDTRNSFDTEFEAIYELTKEDFITNVPFTILKEFRIV